MQIWIREARLFALKTFDSFYFKLSATSVQRYVKRKSSPPPLIFKLTMFTSCLPVVPQASAFFRNGIWIFVIGIYTRGLTLTASLIVATMKNKYICKSIKSSWKNSDITYRNFDLVFSNCNPWSLVRRYRHHSLHSHWHYVQQRNDHRNRSLQIIKWRLKQNFRF